MKRLLLSGTVLILAACSSNKEPEYIKANSEPLVYMSTAKPPLNCKLLGYTSGPYHTYGVGNNSQGRNLHQSHINQAIRLGGNYLQKDHQRDKGYVYSCPESEILKMEKTNK